MVIDIDFRKSGLAHELSNLQRREFTFKGVDVLGIESILVACKHPDLDQQLYLSLIHI